MSVWRGVIEQYRQFLPVTPRTPIVSLREGHTPLVYSRWLSGLLGDGADVWLKCEGANPTGSFKDRGMTLAVSKAIEEGADSVICASTGNTSASASAYAAQAGIKSIVLIPKGAIALGKLAQALVHGAQVLAVDGNFDDCLGLVKEVAAAFPVTLVNSINPHRIAGQKTGAFEICDALGDAPDVHVMPVGNAGNITAYWRGYREYRQAGRAQRLPRMVGFQAAGAAPIVMGHPVDAPQTIATAIRIGRPASWREAEAARDASGGLIDAVTDEDILAAYLSLASREGLFVEPASAAAVAGIVKLHAQQYFQQQRVDGRICVVAVLTGHGLKDPALAVSSVREPATVRPVLPAVLERIGYA